MSPSAPLSEPHHDGSPLYVPEQPVEIGDEVTVRLRVPRSVSVDGAAVRYVRDGEPRGVPATVDEETETDVWYRATVPVWNPTVPYRWVLGGGDVGYAWVNGAGLFRHDVPDDHDFMLSLAPSGPDWHAEGVVYEIFPDRFATTGAFGRDGDRPDWAVPRGWDELPTGRGPQTPFELFGGDLRGIEQHLDHVEGLGATVIYLTPVFPAGSTHRYDASSFGRVDPLLGGDAALASLSRAAHERGLRLVGDLTLNHCGSSHEWFVAARQSADAPERDLFYFDDALPGGYEAWMGVRSLPKLAWGSPELRRRMTEVTRQWLEPPYDLDGWRIDVANMVGRYRDLAVTASVASEIRRTVGDKLLLAEHGHDFRADLQGDGWQGSMNYSGFLRPVWTWLRGEELPEELLSFFWSIPMGLPRLPGEHVVSGMRAFRGGIPWDRVLHSWTLLDSHDTARFRTVAGSREAQLVGVGLQMTTPGVPMIFAGDELGLEGDWGEDARRTMPWSRPESWDRVTLEGYRELVALRRSSPALARGGMRYAHVSADAIAYLRELPGERLLCLAARAGHEPVVLPLSLLGATALETLVGGDADVRGGDAVLPSDGPAFHAWRLT
jgi:alpha-glucosidase